MSRHSKNNTASSVFTYHERKRMQDSGSIHQRLEEDCFRSFEDCFICLFRAENPVASPEGYLYCRKCLISAFAQQKLLWEKSVQEKKIRDAGLQDIDRLNKIREFQVFSDTLVTALPTPVAELKSNRNETILDHSDEEKETEKAYAKQLLLHKPGRRQMRADASSVSFWAPHDEKNKRHHKEPAVLASPPQKFKTVCPITKNRLKLADCLNVVAVADEDDKGKRWLCSISSKVLAHHRVVLDISCGHLILKDVFESLNMKNDVIDMQSGETSYSSHNSVKASLFRPAFG